MGKHDAERDDLNAVAFHIEHRDGVARADVVNDADGYEAVEVFFAERFAGVPPHVLGTFVRFGMDIVDVSEKSGHVIATVQ